MFHGERGDYRLIRRIRTAIRLSTGAAQRFTGLHAEFRIEPHGATIANRSPPGVNRDRRSQRAADHLPCTLHFPAGDDDVDLILYGHLQRASDEGEPPIECPQAQTTEERASD